MCAIQEDAEGEEEEAAVEGATAADGDERICPHWCVFFQIKVVLLRLISTGSYSQRDEVAVAQLQEK